MDRSTIKQMAKEKLTGNWETGLLILVLIPAVTTLVTICTIGTGYIAVVGPLSLGFMMVYNSFLTGEDTDWKKLFSPFKDRFADSFIVGGVDKAISLLPSVLPTVCSVLLYPVFLVAGYVSGAFYIFLRIALMIAVAAVCCIIYYMYQEALYILLREPDIKGFAALKKSRQLMDGNKKSLFLFDLSFIGWLLLVVVTFGIAYIYVKPYYECARLIMLQQIYDENNGREAVRDVVVVEEKTEDEAE